MERRQIITAIVIFLGLSLGVIVGKYIAYKTVIEPAKEQKDKRP